MSATCRQGGACGDKAGNVRPVCPGHSQLEFTTSSTSFDPRSPWGGLQYSETPILHVGKPRRQEAMSHRGSAAAPRAVRLQDPPSGLLPVRRGLRGSPPTQCPPVVETPFVLHQSLRGRPL